MIDAASFVRLSETGKEAAAAGKSQEAVDALERALSLWRGGRGRTSRSRRLPCLSSPTLSASRRSRRGQKRYWASDDTRNLSAGSNRREANTRSVSDGEGRFTDDAVSARGHRPAPFRARGRSLERIAELRRTLSTELGIEPSAVAQSLECQILARDEALEFEQPAQPMSREGRKTIVALACITMDDHTLEPEAHRFETAKRIEEVTVAVSGRDGTVADDSGSVVVVTFGIRRSTRSSFARSSIGSGARALSSFTSSCSRTSSRPLRWATSGRLGRRGRSPTCSSCRGGSDGLRAARRDAARAAARAWRS
jgi:Bacterial transcriptional activator domain